MSATGPNKQCKNSFHWRNNSGELDVFEAARYFSGAGENPRYNDSSMFSPKNIGENRSHGQRASRMSLDIPMMRNIPIRSENIPTIQKLQLKDSKKCKQPNSPGGRLASFLNSLFNQTESKKKKLKLKEEGRKRRSSISHFRITSINSGNESKSSSSSGVITPHTETKTPTKSSCKEFRGFSDQQTAIDGEEFRFHNGRFRNSTAINWIVDEEDRGFKKFSDVDDGADTDSSSDLFDLPNYDLDLPVYGTTDMDRIRIGAPISSV
ncbi:hypothetical protein ACS0TY_009729 [Phlomoides rotata]